MLIEWGIYFHQKRAPKTKLSPKQDTFKLLLKILVYFQAYLNFYLPKEWEKWEKFEVWKKKFRFQKKNFRLRYRYWNQNSVSHYCVKRQMITMWKITTATSGCMKIEGHKEMYLSVSRSSNSPRVLYNLHCVAYL